MKEMRRAGEKKHKRGQERHLDGVDTSKVTEKRDIKLRELMVERGERNEMSLSHVTP